MSSRHRSRPEGCFPIGGALAVAAALLLFGAGDCLAQQTTPAAEPKAQAQPAPWYEPEIRAFEDADRAHPPEPGRVLFVGSSSIRLWASLASDMEPAKVLNRGFGGSKTHDVLEVLDRIVKPYAPRAIVYYCGDNDLGTDNTDAKAAADGFIAFAERARALWPEVPIAYIAIKPSVARWKNWDAMSRANQMVREYAQRTQGVAFLDIASPMLKADGTPDPSLFKSDGLHLNAKGYAVWTGVVRPWVLEHSGHAETNHHTGPAR